MSGRCTGETKMNESKQKPNKIIPKTSTLYCFHCMREQPVKEGNVDNGVLPIFCTVCKKQISELIATQEGWKLHKCFYKSGFTERRCGEGDNIK